MTTLHPFDLVFRALVPTFERLRGAESDALRDPAAFAGNAHVRQALERVEAPELVAQDPMAAGEYHMALFAAFRFWECGERTYPVERSALETVLHDPVKPVAPDAPDGACYVRLPTRMFWAQVAPDAVHEPVDGFFLTVGPDGEQWILVFVLGLRPERRGFSQLSVSAHRPDLAAAFAAVSTPCFVPAMDGGNEAGFRSIRTAADALVLAQLALVQAAR